MAVYVDELRALLTPNRHWPADQSCHMMADDDAELEAFARRLGLRKSWRHGDHYDLTPNKRISAVRAGAAEITSQMMVYLRRLHEKRG